MYFGREQKIGLGYMYTGCFWKCVYFLNLMHNAFIFYRRLGGGEGAIHPAIWAKTPEGMASKWSKVFIEELWNSYSALNSCWITNKAN